jgi:two-component system, OmpR family, copper resistance phosphate regulon response regulator CusR
MQMLVIEDEAKVADALRSGLEGEGYEVTVAYTGEDGFLLLNERAVDLVILDLMLPGRDGLSLLTTMRRRGLGVPVIILTARDTVEDRVIGLNAGADDYLVKPFALSELVARIQALLRRGRKEDLLRLRAGDLEMDLVTRQVRRGERLLDLTAREYEILEHLLRQVGHAVSREHLARVVWQDSEMTPALSNVIDVHITRLRRKVEVPGTGKLIRTVRGIGYKVLEKLE